VYVPDTGDADTVGGGVIVYVEVTTGLVLPKLFFAKNFKVVVVDIDTGLEYTGLDIVGVVPSLV